MSVHLFSLKAKFNLQPAHNLTLAKIDSVLSVSAPGLKREGPVFSRDLVRPKARRHLRGVGQGAC